MRELEGEPLNPRVQRTARLRRPAADAPSRCPDEVKIWLDRSS